MCKYIRHWTGEVDIGQPTCLHDANERGVQLEGGLMGARVAIELVPNHHTTLHENDVLGNIRGEIRNSLQVTGRRQG